MKKGPSGNIFWVRENEGRKRGLEEIDVNPGFSLVGFGKPKIKVEEEENSPYNGGRKKRSKDMRRKSVATLASGMSSLAGPSLARKSFLASCLYLHYLSKGYGEKGKYEYEAKDLIHQYGKEGDLLLKEISSLLDDSRIKKEDYALIASSLSSGNKKEKEVSSSSSEGLSYLVYHLLDLKDNETLLDPCSGYGDFLIEAGKMAKKEGIRLSFLGQENDMETSLSSLLIMEMNDLEGEILMEDTLLSPSLSFDKAYIYPPIRYRASRREINELLKKMALPIDGFISPTWLFLLKAIEGLTEKGKIVFLVKESLLSNEAGKKMRKHLLDSQLLEGVISLEEGAIEGTSEKMHLLLIKKNSPSFYAYDELKTPNKFFMKEDAERILSRLPKKGGLLPQEVEDPYDLSSSSLIYAPFREKKRNYRPLGEIADIFSGPRYTRGDYEKKGMMSEEITKYRLLEASNIRNHDVDYGSLPYLDIPTDFMGKLAKKGDIVISNRTTVIKSAYLEGDEETFYVPSGGMLIVRVKEGMMDPRYLKMFLDSEKGKKALESVSKGGAIISLSSSSLMKMEVPFPPSKKEGELSFPLHLDEYGEKVIELKKHLEEMKKLEKEIKELSDYEFALLEKAE